jgi:hypothetical protein
VRPPDRRDKDRSGQRDLLRARQVLGSVPRDQPHAERRQQQTEEGAPQCEHGALSPQVLEQPPPRRSECGAYRELAGSVCHSSQEQVRRVHGCDQQHEGHRTQNQDQHGPNVSDHRVLEAHHGPGGFPVLERLLPDGEEPGADELELLLCHRGVGSLRQTSQRLDEERPSPFRRVPPRNHEEVTVHFQRTRPGRQHPYHRIELPVETDRLAHGPPVSA